MKNLMKLSVVLVVVAMAFSSCNCFKKMAKNQNEVQVSTSPEILNLVKGSVPVDINVTFPTKYFNSKAVVKVTPVLVFEGGEVAAPAKFLQGSKVKENYTVVAKDGGKFTHHVEFAYDSRMEKSMLQLRAEVKCSKGELTLVNLNTGAMPTKEQAAVLAGTDQAAIAALVSEFSLTIAYGVNVMSNDLSYSDLMEQQANNYKRVTTLVNKADLLYTINSSKVTKKAAANESLEGFKSNVDATMSNDRASQHISVKGYASPDGPVSFNDKLSKARSETGKTTVAKLLKDSGLDIDAAAYGEDWEGFKEMVAKSDIKDKNLILQVLSLYSSSIQREMEIKNMSTVFGELKEDILPQLRRAQVVNTTDVQGKTDAEMIAFIDAKDYAALTNEELLFAAETLVKSPAVKASVLSYTAKTYNDVRAYNNLGVAQSEMKDYKAALASFEKASKLGDSSKELSKNLAIAYLANGDIAEAKQYAAGAGADVQSAIAVAEGNYTSASKFEGVNAAIVSILNNDFAAANKAIANDKSATADYLRAVMASKEGNLSVAGAQLKSAVSKDASLKAKALKDVNLKNLMDSDFKF